MTSLQLHASAVPPIDPSSWPDLSTLTIDQRIDWFARQHDGLIDDAAAECLAVSPKAIRHRRDKGTLVLVHPRVYRCSGAPITAKQQLRAACWTVGSLIAVSHRSAALLWMPDLGLDPELDVVMNRTHTPDLVGINLHRSMDLADHHVTELDGLPVTNLPRTIVDIGAFLPWWLVERTLETANSRKLVTIGEVLSIREELSKRGRDGVGVLGEVLDRRGLGDVDSQSVLESKFARLLREYGIDGVEYQHHVVVDGADRYLDFSIPALRLAFELKGYDRHSRWSVFTDDCRRSNGLTLAGWTVIEFTWDDIVNRPGYVARVIREAIRQAASERARV